MTLKNIKSKGFTIVELLVVIVVIGILAAITMVSYSGVTAKANTTKALANARSVLSVIEIYYAEKGYYPATTTLIETNDTSAKLPSGTTVVPNAAPNPLSTATGDAKFNVTYECNATCGSGTHTGGRVTYWDFTNGSPVTTLTYGTGGTGFYPAS